jgi:hypothetical protein
MPGGGGVSVGLFTLGAAAGLPGSSPSHGLNPALVAGCGEVDSLDVPGVVVESAAPEVDEFVEEADEVVEGAIKVVEGADEVVEGTVEVVEGAVEVVEGAVEVVEGAVEVVEGAVNDPDAAPLPVVELSQSPGLAIEMVAATAYRKMYLLVLRIFLVEHCLIDCIE